MRLAAGRTRGRRTWRAAAAPGLQRRARRRAARHRRRASATCTRSTAGCRGSSSARCSPRRSSSDEPRRTSCSSASTAPPTSTPTTRPRAGRGNVGGLRSDTIMVLRVDPAPSGRSLLSLPARPLGAAGQRRHTSASTAPSRTAGPSELIDTIEQYLGIPINHYVQVDFAGFQELVDVIDGVEVYFADPGPRPPLGPRHRGAGLRHPRRPAGARLRAVAPLPGLRGRPLADRPSADLGRISRQQDFIVRALRRAVDQGARNPRHPRPPRRRRARDRHGRRPAHRRRHHRPGRALPGFDPGSLDLYALPVAAGNVGGASILRLRDEEAQPILDLFRGTDAADLAPGDVRVRVLNGSGSPARPGRPSDALAAAGFGVAGTGEAERFDVTETLVRYTAGERGEGRPGGPLPRRRAPRSSWSTGPLEADVVVVTGSQLAGRARPRRGPGDRRPRPPPPTHHDHHRARRPTDVVDHLHHRRRLRARGPGGRRLLTLAAAFAGRARLAGHGRLPPLCHRRRAPGGGPMKGIVLAGGRATRLSPASRATSKQLMHVYDKPLVYYPISTLLHARINEILIISTPGAAAAVRGAPRRRPPVGLLVHLRRAAGAERHRRRLPHRRGVHRRRRRGPGPRRQHLLRRRASASSCSSTPSPKGAVVFGLWVPDPERYGVLELDADGEVVGVHEKPADPPSNFMIPGLYFYDNSVVEVAGVHRAERPRRARDQRGQQPLPARRAASRCASCPFSTEWFDVGTFDALLDAQTWVAGQQRRKGLLIGVPGDGGPPRGVHHHRPAARARRRRRPGRRPGQERLRRAPPALPRVRGGAEPMVEIIDFDVRAHRHRRAAAPHDEAGHRRAGHRPRVLPGVRLRRRRPARRSGPWRQVNVTETRRGGAAGHARRGHGEARGRRGGRGLRAPTSTCGPTSATYGKVVTTTLAPGHQVLVPKGVGNGFQATVRGRLPVPLLLRPGVGARAWPGVACTPLDPALGHRLAAAHRPRRPRAGLGQGPRRARCSPTSEEADR